MPEAVVENNMIIFLIIVELVTIHCCTALHVVAGGKADLRFSYPCDSSFVTLRHGHKLSFYNSTNPEQTSSRHYVVNEQIRATGDKCSLHLTIYPVTRNNEGTYILSVYRSGITLPDYQRIRLQVENILGKVSCEIKNKYHGEWVKLHCSVSSMGTLGQIVCYQGDRRVPPLTEPKENGRTLGQMMLATLSDPVYCCSSPLERTKDPYQCTDWGWDPINNTLIHDTISNHIPQMLPATELISSTIHSPSNMSNTTRIWQANRPTGFPLTKMSDEFELNIKSGFLVIGLLSLIVLVIGTYVCLYGIRRTEPGSKDDTIFQSV